MPTRDQQRWLVPTVIGIGTVILGGMSFAIGRLFMSGWPDTGDKCSLETYERLLGEHNVKDTVAQRAWTYMPWARYAARYFGVDPTLLAGLVHTESQWNPNAGSNAGAMGLSQHIPSTAVNRFRILTEEGRWPFSELRQNNDPQADGYLETQGVQNWLDRTDPRQSLWLGAASIRALLDYGKGTEWALAAYNGGPAVANKAVEDRPAETQAYVPGVLKRQGWYQEIDASC